MWLKWLRIVFNFSLLFILMMLSSAAIFCYCSEKRWILTFNLKNLRMCQALSSLEHYAALQRLPVIRVRRLKGQNRCDVPLAFSELTERLILFSRVTPFENRWRDGAEVGHGASSRDGFFRLHLVCHRKLDGTWLTCIQVKDESDYKCLLMQGKRKPVVQFLMKLWFH